MNAHRSAWSRANAAMSASARAGSMDTTSVPGLTTAKPNHSGARGRNVLVRAARTPTEVSEDGVENHHRSPDIGHLVVDPAKEPVRLWTVELGDIHQAVTVDELLE